MAANAASPYQGSPLSGEHFAAALEAVRFRCEQRLGHLGDIIVTQHDHFAAVGVGLKLRERTGKWRHAVVSDSNHALNDPIGFADAASEKLLAWHSDRRPEDKGPGGLLGEEELI